MSSNSSCVIRPASSSGTGGSEFWSSSSSPTGGSLLVFHHDASHRGFLRGRRPRHLLPQRQLRLHPILEGAVGRHEIVRPVLLLLVERSEYRVGVVRSVLRL